MIEEKNQEISCTNQIKSQWKTNLVTTHNHQKAIAFFCQSRYVDITIVFVRVFWGCLKTVEFFFNFLNESSNS